MRLYCIADEDTVRGFRLAGIGGRAADSAAAAGPAVAEFAARSDCGVLILTQEVAGMIRGQVEALRHERERPLIVEIPGPHGPAPGHRSLLRVAQEAVGIPFGQGQGEAAS